LLIEGVAYLTRKKSIIDYVGIISISIVVISFLSKIITSFLVTRQLPTGGYPELLINYVDGKLIHTIDSVMVLVSAVFIIPATIGVFAVFYSKIKQEVRNWLFLPTITSIVSSLIIIGLIIPKLLIIFNIAPDYYVAVEPLKSLLMSKYESWISYINIFQVIAYLLLFTIGTGGYGFLSFKYQLTRETSTWLAIFTAVLGLGEIGVFIPGNFGTVIIFMASIASILYFFWLGSIIFVIRQKMVEESKFEAPEELLTDTF
jgi:hypothetical protein